MIYEILNFVVFCANIAGFAFFNFNESKKDPSFFSDCHSDFTSQNYLKEQIINFPFGLFVEEALFSVYFPELLNYFGILNSFMLNQLRLIFAIYQIIFPLLKNQLVMSPFVYSHVIHRYILSLFTIGSPPLASYLLHILNNSVVILLRAHLHNEYQQKNPNSNPNSNSNTNLKQPVGEEIVEDSFIESDHPETDTEPETEPDVPTDPITPSTPEFFENLKSPRVLIEPEEGINEIDDITRKKED